MNKVHLFNPENDLALALGCRHYTPPPHASALHRAGALLPAWWAGADDSIILPPRSGGDYTDDLAWLNARWGLSTRPYIATEEDSTLSPSPWGWSLDTCRQFVQAGFPATRLPDHATVDTLRLLSHRRSSIRILSALGEERLLPAEVTDPGVAVEIETSHPGCFFKSPWSCSGRGVFCAGGITPEVIRSKAQGIIHRQGSVMVEHGYDKITDFATLFYSDGKEVTFRGLSLFITENRGVYSGNVVAPQAVILDMIDRSANHASPSSHPSIPHRISDLTSALGQVLTDLICPHYTGWLGIDMMIYRDTGGEIRIHPCIELNLRMTMGVVAMHVADRLNPSTPGLISWQRTVTAPDHHTLLLPPRDGFAMTLDSHPGL